MMFFCFSAWSSDPLVQFPRSCSLWSALRSSFRILLFFNFQKKGLDPWIQISSFRHLVLWIEARLEPTVSVNFLIETFLKKTLDFKNKNGSFAASFFDFDSSKSVFVRKFRIRKFFEKVLDSKKWFGSFRCLFVLFNFNSLLTQIFRNKETEKVKKVLDLDSVICSFATSFISQGSFGLRTLLKSDRKNENLNKISWRAELILSEWSLSLIGSGCSLKFKLCDWL